MRLKLVPGLVILLVLVGAFFSGKAILQAQATGNTCYVDDTATGANDGSRWADAFTDLQTALNPANNCTEIRVAAGTYYPTTLNDPSATFQLHSGVAVIGGYPDGGGDTADPSANSTILDGDNNQPDNIYNYSWHVVTGDGTDATAILDGFTITDGLAASDMDIYGGGISIDGGSPTLRNLVITGNASKSGGGGIYLHNSNPTLTDITISGNGDRVFHTGNGDISVSDPKGGGLYVTGNSNPKLTHVTFTGNIADIGGGMYSGIDYFGNAGNPDRKSVV
jgi:hypothetical protein